MYASLSDKSRTACKSGAPFRFSPTHRARHIFSSAVRQCRLPYSSDTALRPRLENLCRHKSARFPETVHHEYLSAPRLRSVSGIRQDCRSSTTEFFRRKGFVQIRCHVFSRVYIRECLKKCFAGKRLQNTQIFHSTLSEKRNHFCSFLTVRCQHISPPYFSRLISLCRFFRNAPACAPSICV